MMCVVCHRLHHSGEGIRVERLDRVVTRSLSAKKCGQAPDGNRLSLDAACINANVCTTSIGNFPFRNQLYPGLPVESQVFSQVKRSTSSAPPRRTFPPATEHL